MWASRRRGIIILLISSFFLVFFVLPYWWSSRVPPTCVDGKKNQDEVGVDCGGACALVCQGGAKNLTILWTKIFAVREGVYDIVSYVENSNFSIGAENVPYVAKLYDKNGTVIAEESGSTYAKPNELFAIFRGNMRTGGKIAVTGSIEIPNNIVWRTSAREEQIFSVDSKRLTDAEKKPKLTAIMHNEHPRIYRDVDVTAIIYDAQHEPIGVSSTRVFKIDKNSSEVLNFTWPSPFNFVAETEECALPADVVLALDRSGSMASESKTPPQPFTRVREATSAFVDFISQRDQVGVVSFSTTASNPIDLPLMDDRVRIKSKIESIMMGTDGIQYTNTADALQRAGGELGTLRARDEARKIIILLTDGEALEPNRPLLDGEPGYARRYAIETADELRLAGVSVYTIGLGVNANDEFLKLISTTPEYYYASPSVSDLRGVYRQIAGAICKKGPSAIEIITRVQNAD